MFGVGCESSVEMGVICFSEVSCPCLHSYSSKETFNTDYCKSVVLPSGFSGIFGGYLACIGFLFTFKCNTLGRIHYPSLLNLFHKGMREAIIEISFLSFCLPLLLQYYVFYPVLLVVFIASSAV